MAHHGADGVQVTVERVEMVAQEEAVEAVLWVRLLLEQELQHYLMVLLKA